MCVCVEKIAFSDTYRKREYHFSLGNIVDAGSTVLPFNIAGFKLNSALHSTGQDVVYHTHSHAGTAVSREGCYWDVVNIGNWGVTGSYLTRGRLTIRGLKGRGFNLE